MKVVKRLVLTWPEYKQLAKQTLGLNDELELSVEGKTPTRRKEEARSRFFCRVCSKTFSTKYYLRLHKDEFGHHERKMRKQRTTRRMSAATKAKISKAMKARWTDKPNGHTTMHRGGEAHA